MNEQKSGLRSEIACLVFFSFDLIWISSIVCASCFVTFYCSFLSLPLVISSRDHRFVNYSVSSFGWLIVVFFAGALFPLVVIVAVKRINQMKDSRTLRKQFRFQFHLGHIAVVFVAVALFCSLLVETRSNRYSMILRVVCLLVPLFFCRTKSRRIFLLCVLLSRFFVFDLEYREMYDYAVGFGFGITMVLDDMYFGIVGIWISLSGFSFEVLQHIRIIFRSDVYPATRELFEQASIFGIGFAIILTCSSLVRLFPLGLLRKELQAISFFVRIGQANPNAP